MKASKQEAEYLEGLKQHALKYPLTTIESTLYLRLLDAVGIQVYGVCKHCSKEVSADCNCCASCADERGP